MSDREELVDEFFEQASRLSPEERESFFAARAAENGANTGVLDEVRALLTNYRRADAKGFLQQPVGAHGSSFALTDGQEFEGYTIVQLIAEGGMGEVYLAADKQLKRKVALKLVKGHGTKDILRRFHSERQILANLNHPNIARLFDGGTTDNGLPYFVMEYIDGQAIHEFCDEKKLSTTERLELFRTVCAAVEHAHQRLVIHRDLKPQNILITRDGVPKLLDFGIAKVLHAEASESSSALTATEFRVMTPEYASPEQVRGEPVTTATDVYSLALVLFELLTGHRPYRFKNKRPDEVAKVICEEEPDRPSTAISRREELPSADGSGTRTVTPESVSLVRDGTPEKLRRRLQGDLDNIVMMALRKEPERRYGSVQQLSEDLQRHLSGLPVIAHQGSYRYRSAKFIQRHKAAVAVTAVILMTLVGGIIATGWQARVARVERTKAQQRFNDVRKLANSFMFEVYEEIDKGPTKAKELLIKRALEYLDSLAQEASGDEGLQRELASAYERVGLTQGNSYYPNLGDAEGARKSYEKSLAMRLSLAGATPDNREIQRELSDSYLGLGDVLYTMGDLQGGLKHYELALAIREKLVGAEPKNVKYRRALAENYFRIGDIKGMEAYSNLGDVAGALDAYRKQLKINEELAAEDPENNQLQFNLAVVLGQAGRMADVVGDVKGALAMLRRALDLLEKISAAEPNNTSFRVQLFVTQSALRYALIDDNRLDESIERSRKTITALESMSAADPQNTFLRRGIALIYNSLGADLLSQGDASAAIENHRKALGITEALMAANPKSEENKADLAFTIHRLGEAQLGAREFRPALESFRKALGMREELLKIDPANARTREAVSRIQAGIGKALAGTGDLQGALGAFGKSVPLAEELSAQSPMNVIWRRELASRYFELGKIYEQEARTGRNNAEKHGSCEKARDYFQRSLSLWQEMRKAGTLIPASANKPEEVSREMSRCES